MVKRYLLRIVLVCSITTLFFNKVSAQYARSGQADPRLLKSIYWLTFGDVNASYTGDGNTGTTGSTLVSAPNSYLGASTPTQTGNDNVGPSIVAGHYVWKFSPTVTISADISNISFTDPTHTRIRPHTPGVGEGSGSDRLNYLFNPNTPFVTGSGGIPNVGIGGPYGASATLNIKLYVSLKVGPAAADTVSLPYPGMVIADAESMSSPASGEYFSATTPNSLKFQLLSKLFAPSGNYNNSNQPYTDADANNYKLILENSGQKFTIKNTTPTDGSSANGNYGITAVMYVDGAKEIDNITLKGEGSTAVAVGFILPFDLGDAPSSYGFTGNYIDNFAPQTQFPTDGTYSINTTTPQAVLSPLANVYIGTVSSDPTNTPTVDPDGQQIGNVYASVDDSSFVNDESTFTGANKPTMKVNQDGDLTLNVPSVTNGKNVAAKLYCWVDLNSDGKFTQNEEKELVVPSNTSAQSYSFTYANALFKNFIKAGPNYIRLRVTTTTIPNNLSNSDNTTVDPRSQSYVADGETEDYRFDVTGITVSGSVFLDGNGNSDNVVNGTAIGNVASGNTTQQLYAYLANGTASNSVLLQKVAVGVTAPNVGAFSFTGVNTGTFTVAISTVNATIDGTTTLAAVPATLPTPYVPINASYGTNNVGQTTDALQTGTPNLQITVTTPVTSLDVSGIKLGMDRPPVANDDGGGIQTSGTLPITVLTNDTDPEGNTTIDKTKVQLVDPTNAAARGTSYTVGTKGTFTVNPTTGVITFVAAATFNSGNSPASIAYTVKDLAGAESNAATITITYAAGPAAAPDSLKTTIGVAKNQDLRVNDGDPTGTVDVTTTPSHGTAIKQNDNSVTYTPTSGYTGKDSFLYTVTNGTGSSAPTRVDVIVKPVGVADVDSVAAGATTPRAINVTGNDGASGSNTGTTVTGLPATSTKGGTIALANDGKTVNYTPAAGYAGLDTFTYTLTTADGVVSDPITVTVRVKPVGSTDALNTTINASAVVQDVKSNDASRTVSGITVKPVATATTKGGTVAADTNGANILYTTPNNYVGVDAYTYTLVTTDNVVSAPITVGVRIKPVGKPDSVQTAIGTPINNIPVLANDGVSGSAAGIILTKTTDPTKGSVTLNQDNTFTYTPTANATGTDSFTYTLTTSAATGSVASDPVTVFITINANGVPDSYSTPINTTVASTNVKGNDGNAYSAATVTLTNASGTTTATTTKGGTISVNQDQTVSYKPAQDFVGKDTYYYTLTNNGVTTPPILVTVNVQPTGVNDTYVTRTNTPKTNTVKDNDGPSGTTTGVVLALGTTAPTNGNVALNQAGTAFVYTPNNNFAGTDTYTYTLTTADGVSSAQITVTENIISKGADDTDGTIINTPVTKDVKANDGSDNANATVNLPTATTTKGGTVINDGTNKVNYTPPTNFSGIDTYTYTLTTSGSVSAPLTVTVRVKPIGVNDVYSTAVGIPVVNDVKTNDGASANGTTLTVVTQPAHGSVSAPNTANTTFTYTPAAGYVGTDTYTYTLTTADGVVSDPITVTINIVAPTANGSNDADVTRINTPKITNVKANDGATFTNATVTPIATSAKGGTIVNDGNGNLIYTPPANFIGVDTYTYTLTNAGGTPGAPVTVTMAVKPVGVRDVYNTGINIAIPNSVKDNDGPSATGTTVTAVTLPAKGTVVANGTAAAFTYTPNTGYVGTDTYTYTLTTADGVVSDPITVVINIANSGANGTLTGGGTPDADLTLVGTTKTTNVKANDGTNYTSATVTPTATSAKGGSIINDGSGNLAYTPATGFTGIDTYTYTLTNTGGTPTSPITVTVTVRPVGVNDTYSTNTGVAIPNTVKDNDGASATGTTVKVVDPPIYGTVAANTGTNPNTSFTYTPPAGFNGTDTYTYALVTSDGVTSAPITVTIKVTPVGTAGTDDTETTTINTPVTTNVKGNDGPSFTNAVVTPTATTTKGGTAVNDGADKVVYTPPANFSGKDTYTYTLTNTGGTPTAPVTVTVSVKPTGINDTYSTAVGVAVVNDVKVNDGAGANGTTLAVVTQPTHGAISAPNTANTTFTYTPAAGYTGTDTYTYTLTTVDGVVSDPITVTINIVTPGTNGSNDADITPINTAKATNVKANDGTTFANATVTPSTTSTKGGTTVNDGNGNLLYTPPTNFIGKDTYTYTLTNSGGTAGAPVTVTISVKPVGVRDVYNTGINIAVVNNVKDNDGPSATGTTVAAVTQPLHGTVAANGTNTGFTYTPTTGYVGTDTYTYTLTTTDGVVSDPITVVVNIANSGTSGTLTTGGTPDADVTFVGTAKTTNVKANDGTNYTNATVTPTATSTKAGTVTNDGNGNLVYTPAAGFIGIDTYTYTLTNTGGTPTSPITVTIRVRPVGVNDKYSTSTGVAIPNTVKDNDGASATGTTVKVVDPPIYGTVAANTGTNPNTSFTYTPPAGFNGTDTYTYSLITTDGVVSAPITVTITVAPAATVGTDDTEATTINTPVTTNVKGNDGPSFTNAVVTPTATTTKGGTAVNDGADKVVYTPPADYSGKDTYTYTLTNAGGTPTAPVTVTVSVKPTGVRDIYSTAVGVPVVNDVKTNDGAGANGTTLAVITQPAHGSVSAPNTANTTFTYTPTAGYVGTDTYTYTLTTADGVVSDPITVAITIVTPGANGSNDADVTRINTPKVTNVKANDGATFANATVTPSATSAKGGTITNDGNGNLIYTPAVNFIGLDTYTYTLTNAGGTPAAPVTVTMAVKPVGVRDVYNTGINTAVVNNVKDNDGPSAIGTTVAAVTQPLHGTVAANGTNTGFTYTPTTGYVGTDTYTYTLTTTDGVVSDPITVVVNIANSGANGTLTAGGTPDADQTLVGVARTTNVKANDGTNYTNATVTPTASSAKAGTVTNDGSGNLIYTPAAGFTGIDTYTYTLTNAGSTPTSPITVTITVRPVGVNDTYSTTVNTAIANTVKDNDGASATGTTVKVVTPPTYGTVTANTGNTAFTYTPANNYVGADTYSYSLTTADGVTSAPITVTVTVNGKPTGVNDAYTTAINTPIVNDVKANDGAAASTTVAVVTQPAHGTVAANAGNTAFTYTPATGYVGTDTYTYTLTTAGGAVSDPITVTITIINNGIPDNAITTVGTPVTTDVKANDGPNFTNATVTPSPTTTKGGTAVNDGTGKVTYTPPAGFTGKDTYTYTLTNSGGTPTSPVTVNVSVKPVGVNDTYSTAVNTPLVNDVKSNDGASATGTTVAVATAPLHGTVVANGASTNFTYTPATGYVGTDTYTYTLTTADGVISDPISVTITIVTPGANGTPDFDTTPINTAKTTNVKANDGTNFTNATVTPSATSSKGGTVINDGTGNLIYTPPTGFIGKDTYTYTLTNAGSAPTSPIVVTISVKPVGVTDNFATSLNTPVANDVKANDGASATGTTIAVVTQPLHGTVTPNSANTQFAYVPTAGYVGTDTYTYTLTTADGVVSDPITVNITITSVSLTFTKVATSGASAVGDVITYNLVVTNNGAAPITNIRVTDAGADAGSISPATVATLAAGASTTVTAKHTVTAADVAAGSYSNQASVTATDINGNTVSKPKSDNPATPAVDDPTVVPILPKGSISLVKTGVSDYTSVTYTFTVTNTGTVTLNNISLTDALLNITNSPITVQGGLAAGAKTTVTFKYTLTQADRDAAKVTNVASISAVDANNNTITNTATVTNSVPPAPTAMPDPVSTQVGSSVTITPSKNDSQSGAAFVAIEILQQPKHGTLKVNADLTVTYTPDPGYNGPDSFTYRLRDLNGFYTNAAAVAISDGFVNNLTIPNTFTPNGDGINDTFEIIGIENYPSNELIIVNRWGNEVYHKTNYTKEWTGEGLNEGTYYFLLHLKNADGSDLEVIKGYVSLIRNKVN
ncbi:Ig-like domain-containing protein [Mucilaginibacter ginkgonis]|uniref:Tandem-95 repeat protein n=1 Tax=Mucilaginibacter ginkgonis TaxID=2682091 RepID=A0A6I4HUT0_9SPHI|nr:Ig-like domain-containing protein [Mucilaginibacter ginkgonis]QQL50322.1 tandem-95 repeat protein [Mucilaginibacter ginkgonis]